MIVVSIFALIENNISLMVINRLKMTKSTWNI